MDIRPPTKRPSRLQLSNSFLQTAQSQGLQIRRASQKEKLEDIDFVTWRLRDGEPVEIAAVSLKKTVLRKAKKRKELWGWVEFHDRKGSPGWFFKKSTFLAFPRKNDFLLIVKSDFIKWLNSGIINWQIVDNSWNARYRIFRREGTRESIAQFKLSHAMQHCRHYKWPLHEGSS